MKYKLLLFLTFCSSLFIYFSCHKKKDSPNPCSGVSRTIATFKVEETTFYDSDIPGVFDYESDTISSGYAKFIVTSEVDSVKWLIGTGVYTNKEQVIHFGTLDKPLVPVTLIVYRKPQTICFPDDKSSDTLTKTIYVAPSATKVYGTYRGSWESSPSDTFSLSFIRDYTRTSSVYLITNFDKTGCSHYVGGTIGYRKAWIEDFYSDTASICSWACFLYGTLMLKPDGDKVTITYSTNNGSSQAYDPSSIIMHTFNGKRVP